MTQLKDDESFTYYTVFFVYVYVAVSGLEGEVVYPKLA